jgi:hypothetical protein
MPRKPKTADPVTQPATTTPAEPQGSKTAAVTAALKANPNTQPKEIAESLQAAGWDAKTQYVSTIKSKLKAQRKAKRAAPAAAPKETPAPKAADAISLDALKKVKELAAQLGGIKQAKAVIAALAELVD